jgi:hypothetical protein
MPPDAFELTVRTVVPCPVFADDFQILGHRSPCLLASLKTVALGQFLPRV